MYDFFFRTINEKRQIVTLTHHLYEKIAVLKIPY